MSSFPSNDLSSVNAHLLSSISAASSSTSSSCVSTRERCSCSSNWQTDKLTNEINWRNEIEFLIITESMNYLFFGGKFPSTVCVFRRCLPVRVEWSLNDKMFGFLGFEIFSDIGNYLNSSEMFRSAPHTVSRHVRGENIYLNKYRENIHENIFRMFE